MDFCAGIGAGRLALENNGLNCVGYAEIDSDAIKTYSVLHGDNEQNFGDVMKIEPTKLPEFDLLLAGFPCQTFSVLGQRKGLADYRGQIIYGLVNILQKRKIPCFILENVKGLINHNQGQTLNTIVNMLKNAGYTLQYKVLNSIEYGVPQMRERIYFVGVRSDLIDFKKYVIDENKFFLPDLTNYLIDDENIFNDPCSLNTFEKYLKNKYNNNKFIISELLKEELLVLDTRQSDLRLYRNRVPTLRAGRHGILYVKNGSLRKLSGYEALLLQGFTKEYANKVKGKISEQKLLKQAGNAMTVTTIDVIAKKLLKYLSYSNVKYG